MISLSSSFPSVTKMVKLCNQQKTDHPVRPFAYMSFSSRWRWCHSIFLEKHDCVYCEVWVNSLRIVSHYLESSMLTCDLSPFSLSATVGYLLVVSLVLRYMCWVTWRLLWCNWCCLAVLLVVVRNQCTIVDWLVAKVFVNWLINYWDFVGCCYTFVDVVICRVVLFVVAW